MIKHEYMLNHAQQMASFERMFRRCGAGFVEENLGSVLSCASSSALVCCAFSCTEEQLLTFLLVSPLSLLLSLGQEALNSLFLNSQWLWQ